MSSLRYLAAVASLIVVAGCSSSGSPAPAPSGKANTVSGGMCADGDVSAVFRTADALSPGARVTAMLEVTNTSARACTMDGFASFFLTDFAGGSKRKGKPAGEVFSGFDLAPGRRAAAEFRWKQCTEGRANCFVADAAAMTLDLSQSSPKPTLAVQLDGFAGPIAMGADAEQNAWRPVD